MQDPCPESYGMRMIAPDENGQRSLPEGCRKTEDTQSA